MPQGPELFLIIGVIVLLFGGSQLPKLARSLGQAKREFETGTQDAADEGKAKAEPKAETKTTKTETTKAESSETTDAAE
jgi:sec-independent protein translocase protein TatA